MNVKSHNQELTVQVKRALEIILEHKPNRPGEFAYHMWPESKKWNMRVRCGNGVSVGGGMNLAAGGFLGRLKKQGLIYWDWKSTGYDRNYYLTDKAKALLGVNE